MRGKHTRFILSVSLTVALFALAVVAVATAGESKTAKIARAMRAGPPAISKNATIVDVDETVLRPGTNGWTCMPGPWANDLSPMCNDEVWVKLMKAVEAKADFHTERVGIGYMLAGDAIPGSVTDPFDTKEDPGEVWIQEGPHLMIVFPDPKMLEGISEDPHNGGPYVMWKGTPYVHLMVPVAPRSQKKK
jgi:hypothetical protein